MIIVIVRGPLAKTVGNKCAAQVFNIMQVQSLAAPKLDNIELAYVELWSQVKAKSSVQGASENYIIFTSERNPILPRMMMGDP